uniref:PO3Cd1.12 n=1 Tax=uncultured Lysobacteraceae bacterium TaxID=211441 RepID=J9V2D0_9GAMM|nr:pO3Cd1.12 [uncultured Xanthomonadaceae bacterium]
MHHRTEDRSAAMNQCIDDCMKCHTICLETIDYCLHKGGRHADAEHIALLSACADICTTCADTMLRGVSVSPAVCGACAEVCGACAASCEAFGDDAAMQRCAEACRRCEKSCRAMAGMAGMKM